MQVQTPFFVIKRTAVTKEAAVAFGYQLGQRPTTTAQQDRADLIDFCLSGPKEEKVFLSLGDKVRLKKNAGWRHGFPTSGEAVLGGVTLQADGQLRLQFEAADDFNTVRAGSFDISDYVELV